MTDLDFDPDFDIDLAVPGHECDDGHPGTRHAPEHHQVTCERPEGHEGQHHHYEMSEGGLAETWKW